MLWKKKKSSQYIHWRLWVLRLACHSLCMFVLKNKCNAELMFSLLLIGLYASMFEDVLRQWHVFKLSGCLISLK